MAPPEFYPFVRDDILPSFWANAIQRLLSNYVENFKITQLDATTIEVVAGADEAAAIISIGGKWRWNEATVTRAHPGGAAATFDIFVTAKANAIVNAPAPFTDNTDYSFGLAIVAHNAAPPVVAGVVDIYRKVGELVWDGAAITAITQTVGAVPPEVTQAELDAEAAARVAADAGKQPLDADLSAIAALPSGSGPRLPYATGAQAWALTSLSEFARALIGNADAATMRAALGLVLGTDVEAHDADLTALAGLVSAADKLPYATGAQAWALTTLSGFARTLLDDPDAATMRATLGIGAGDLAIGDFVPTSLTGDSGDGKLLAADGRLLSTTTYAAYFAAIGHSGNGGVDPGGGQFRIPDLRGRVPIGVDNMGTAQGAASRLTANGARGNSGGEEKHTLTTPEIPSHTHTDSGFDNASGAGQNPYAISTGNTAQTLTSNATGGGGGHNNMQPFQTWHWRVKVL